MAIHGYKYPNNQWANGQTDKIMKKGGILKI